MQGTTKDKPPVLALVGGFLGAGKTTLLLRAARMLAERGVKAAIITNDQAGGLVDTGFAQAAGVAAGEVAGGCFCCRFSELVEAAERLRAYDPEVIFAEPVGSCIDISATILQPLKAGFGERFRLAPYTVLVDAPAAMRIDGDAEMAYLFHNQIAEADLLCLSKADQWEEPPELGWHFDFRLSARTGREVGAWLGAVLGAGRTAGGRVLGEVDYARYAEAEAALGWLNARARIELRRALSPAMLAGPLMDEIEAELTRAGARIAHLKVLDRASTGYVKASICANGAEPRVDGDLAAPAARRHELTLNLRAVAPPELLESIVRQALDRIDGSFSGMVVEAFRPAAPRPERRIGEVV